MTDPITLAALYTLWSLEDRAHQERLVRLSNREEEVLSSSDSIWSQLMEDEWGDSYSL